MGLDGYPKYLPEVMNILKTILWRAKKNIHFRKTSVKEQPGLAFTKTQEKYNIEKKK